MCEDPNYQRIKSKVKRVKNDICGGVITQELRENAIKFGNNPTLEERDMKVEIVPKECLECPCKTRKVPGMRDAIIKAIREARDPSKTVKDTDFTEWFNLSKSLEHYRMMLEAIDFQNICDMAQGNRLQELLDELEQKRMKNDVFWRAKPIRVEKGPRTFYRDDPQEVVEEKPDPLCQLFSDINSESEVGSKELSRKSSGADGFQSSHSTLHSDNAPRIERVSKVKDVDDISIKGKHETDTKEDTEDTSVKDKNESDTRDDTEDTSVKDKNESDTRDDTEDTDLNHLTLVNSTDETYSLCDEDHKGTKPFNLEPTAWGSKTSMLYVEKESLNFLDNTSESSRKHKGVWSQSNGSSKRDQKSLCNDCQTSHFNFTLKRHKDR